MSFGNPAADTANRYNQQYEGTLGDSMKYGKDMMDRWMPEITNQNGKIDSFLGGLGSFSPERVSATFGSGAAAQAQQANAFNLAMRGQSIANAYGANLGTFAGDSAKMGTIADRLASTTDNPFAVLNNQFLEDAALQSGAQVNQLGSDLAARGLDPSSGAGAAALQALSLGVNKNLMDARRQNMVQGAQFQQQGLGMAGGILGQLGGLNLQNAAGQANAAYQGYQGDIANAGRMDQVAMNNAQLGTQANIATANNMTQASLSNAQMANQVALANAGNQLDWQKAMMGAKLSGLGLQSQNYNALLGAGSSIYNTSLQGMGGLAGQYNQNAQANAQGQGQMAGGLLNGLVSLAGAALPFIL